MIPSLPGDIFHEKQVLNHTWTIEGLLGRGGTGEVYRARNLVTDRVVAIKALALRFSGDAGYLELMRREEAMRDIIHDAVVRYSECSRSAEGHVFLVMDFIDGPALSEVMALRRLAPRDLLIVAHRVASGLVAAHARGIVHRDLSPDNIILRDARVEGAVLIDFGIAKDSGPGARTVVGNQFAGKYEYAAPEQFDGKAVPASDLYALGAVLAAVARGAVPFAGATPAEMIRRKDLPLDTDGLPQPVAGLIDWLSAPDLSARAPSAAAVVARTEALLKGPASAPARRGAATGSKSSRPNSRRWTWLALPVLILLLGGGAGLWWRLAVPAPPVVDIWRLQAGSASDVPLVGLAPDAASAARIGDAFAQATGRAAASAALPLASGMPAPGWADAVTALFPILTDLSGWTVAVEGMGARIAGTAATPALRDATIARLQGWAQVAGITLSLDIDAPRPLLPGDIAAALASHARCGPLVSDLPDSGAAPGAEVTVTGALPDEATATALTQSLRPLLAGRVLRLQTTMLNPDLCRLHAALAGLPDGGMTLRLSEAHRPDPSDDGIYRPGDNPVADVLLPAALAATDGAQLWVAVEDDGRVFNIMSNAADAQNQLDRIGEDADGMRRVRVLWPADAPGVGQGRISFRVDDRDFGKAGLFVLVSRGPLFAERRPGDESTVSFAQALAARRATGGDTILAAGWRILDLRP